MNWLKIGKSGKQYWFSLLGMSLSIFRDFIAKANRFMSNFTNSFSVKYFHLFDHKQKYADPGFYHTNSVVVKMCYFLITELIHPIKAYTYGVAVLYRWASLYARDRHSKSRLAYNEFAYKKTKDNCKFEARFQENRHFSNAHTQNPTKVAYNEGCLYFFV